MEAIPARPQKKPFSLPCVGDAGGADIHWRRPNKWLKKKQILAMQFLFAEFPQRHWLAYLLCFFLPAFIHFLRSIVATMLFLLGIARRSIIHHP
jgi:hypothetical protein